MTKTNTLVPHPVFSKTLATNFLKNKFSRDIKNLRQGNSLECFENTATLHEITKSEKPYVNVIVKKCYSKRNVTLIKHSL